MAKTQARRRARRARPRLKPAQQPYDPLAPSYKTQGDFNRAVKQGARAQVQPDLDTIASEGREAAGAHTQRGTDITNWYGHAQQAAQAGFDRLSEATKGILGTLQGYQGDAQAGLSAALRQQSEAANAEAAKLGVAGPATDPNIARTAAAYGGGNAIGLTGDIAAVLGRGAADIGIRGIEGREANTAETGRYTGITDELRNRRRDVMGRVPALRAQLRSQYGQEELGRAGQAFQQGLANKQFGETVRSNKAGEKNAGRQTKLAESQFGETKRSNLVTEGQRQTELGISQQQADTERRRIQAEIRTAKDPQEKADLEARAKRWDSGVQILQQALAQTDNDVIKKDFDDGTSGVDIKATNKRIKARLKGQFDAIHARIMATTGMGPGEAYRVMMTSNDQGWVSHARKKLQQLKNDRALEGIHKNPDQPPMNKKLKPITKKFPR
jgi:hypothetical protein